MPTAATRRQARRAPPGGLPAFLFALAAAFAAHPPLAAWGEAGERDAALEQAVKAAYVYNFTRFVSWPDDSPLARAPVFSIGVLGDDSFADAVEATVRDKTVEGRPLAVRRFRIADDVVPCPVLYVARAQSGNLPRLQARLQGWPVLTVGDAEGFASRGGMIGLFLKDGRIRFEVRLAAARAAGLEVSSKLLRLSGPEPRRSGAAGSGGGR